jgi:hydrogenase-4 component B
MNWLLLPLFALVAVGFAAAIGLRGGVRRRLFAAIVLAEGGVAAAFAILALGSTHSHLVPLWDLSILGRLSLQATPLGGLFLLVTAVVFAATTPSFVAGSRRYASGWRTTAFLISYQALLASIVLILLAADVITFLFAWELMSLLVFVLVSHDFTDEKVLHPSYLTLAMSEAGSLAGIVGLLLLAARTGSVNFASMASLTASVPGWAAWLVFALAVLGFGVKAGLVPVNAWLPEAYAVAPPPVPAVLSGATLNLGLFAIMKIVGQLLPQRPAFGMIILLLGAVTAVTGIVYANIDVNLRRLLAHSSIENMGIAFAGVGAGLCFLSLGDPVLGAMLLIAGIYQAINHSVYKTLLFIGADAIAASTGTVDMDRLGGLLKRLPWFGLFFLAGTLAIAGLPPFNGFVSEWLTLEGLLRVVQVASPLIRLGFAVAGALLALTAGLAVTCFVMVFGSSFMGIARSRGAAAARRIGRAATLPMAVLAVVCLGLGVLPTLVVPSLNRAVQPIAHASGVGALVPPFFLASAKDAHGMNPGLLHDLSQIGAQVGKGVLPGRGEVLLHAGGKQNPVVFAMSPLYAAAVLLLLLALTYIVFWLVRKRRRVERKKEWDGGLYSLAPSMTYTATAFASPVRVLFNAILRPTITERTETESAGKHFRTAIHRREEHVHVVDRLTLKPLAAGLKWMARLLARMHHGSVNAYAAYILLSLLLVLAIGLLVKPF